MVWTYWKKDINKRWQEYTEELYKKGLHDKDNHDGVVTHTRLACCSLWSCKESDRTEWLTIEWEKLEISSRKLEIPREYFMQRWAQWRTEIVWQPTPVFLPGESQGWGSLMGCHLWGHTHRVGHDWSDLAAAAAAASVFAWRIPGTGEPGGLLSIGSHRVGHDWSDLVAIPCCSC